MGGLIFADGVLYNIIGLIFVVLGIVTLIRCSGFPDLTVDGSFTVSAAVYASTISSGYGVWVAFGGAILAGAMSGLLTWTLNSLLGIGRVVSGVLAMITLILLAPYVAHGATISLLEPGPLDDWLGKLDQQISGALIPSEPYQLHFATIAFWFIVFAIVMIVWIRAFATPPGLRLRYLGSAISPTLIAPPKRKWYLLAGLCAGNALVGIGGAIEAARRGAYTANMGLGVLLVGLAIMILGEAILKTWKRRDYLHIWEQTTALAVGAVVYGVCIQLALLYGPDSIDLRLVSTLMLMVLLALSARFFPNSNKLF